MLFVLPAILFIGFLFVGVWWLFFYKTIRHERIVREARKREADFERMLATPNEPLYCVSCQNLFAGPLDSHGCPQCHIRALVLPARFSEDKEVVARGRQFTLDRFVTACRDGEGDAAPVQETEVRATAENGEKERLPQGIKYP